jgi:protein gp37
LRTTKIKWTQRTWNPVTGCTKFSVGCAHCYAEVMARRLRAMGQAKGMSEIKVNSILDVSMLLLHQGFEKLLILFIYNP